MPVNIDERFEDSQEASRQEMQGQRASLWTAIPVIFKKHDIEKNTVHVQPTIKLKYAKPDGTAEWLTMPELKDVPMMYAGGGGIVHTFPIKDGDEGLVVFSARSIDKWWNEGGVQEQNEFRMHDISDGFAIPGFRSQPRKLNNIHESNHQIRSEDGELYLEFDPENKKIKIKSSNPVEIEGDLHVTGKVVAKYGTGNDVNLDTHKHSGVQPGGSQTQKPVAGT